MTTNMELIGRDEINDLEAILSVCNTDANAIVHAVKANADAVFTWDYERSRTPLIKLYEKAKTSQWNGSTDLDWSTPVDPERVALEMAPAAAMFQQRMAELPGSPVARWGPKEWTQFQVEALNWRMSQFLHGEQGALICTAKIVPNAKKLGLLDAGDGWLRQRFTELGVIQFEDWTDTAEEYSELDAVAADRA